MGQKCAGRVVSQFMLNQFNVEYERTAIGCALRNFANVAKARLDAGDFYNQQNAKLWELACRASVVGSDNFLDAMFRAGFDGETKTLVDLYDLAAPGTDITFYSDKIRELANNRRQLKIIQEAAKRAESEQDISAVASGLISDLKDVISPPGALVNMTNVLDQYAYDLQHGVPERKLLTFRDLDWQIEGLFDGGLYIIAARPGAGKSAFTLELARRAAIQGRTSVFISLEMKARKQAQRLHCAEARKQARELTANDIKDIQRVREQMAGRLYILDSGAATVARIGALARSVDAGVLFVDHVGLVLPSGKHQNKTGAVTEISRDLKCLAMDMRIPIVLLCQLNRDSVKGDEKRPGLHHLRDSGALEQDAECALFLYREKYAQVDAINEPGMVEVLIRKNREGPLGTVNLYYDPSQHYFEQQNPRFDYPESRREKLPRQQMEIAPV